MTTDGIGGVVPRNERRERIAAALGGDRQGHAFFYRGAYHAFPAVRLPIGLLLYRVENGRIVAELAAEAGRNGRSLDDVRSREEDADVQALLHRLLFDKAGNPAGDVLRELRRHGVQTEPLLVTVDGVVVNGNRRLAAMRALVAEDPARYAGFLEVTAAVMPADAGAADFEIIEAGLQMAPETKLAYGWMNRRMKLRHQRDVLRLPKAEIADAYRFEREDAIDEEIEDLALAERFLAERGGSAEAIADAGDLFTGLATELRQMTVERRDLWRTIGFAMISERREKPVKGVFPLGKPLTLDHPQRIAASLRADFGAGASEGPLDKLVEGVPAGEITARVIDIADELRHEREQGEAPMRLVRHVTRARKLLEGIDPSALTPIQRRRLAGDLAAIQANLASVQATAPAAPTPVAGKPAAGEAAGGIAGIVGRITGRKA